MPPNAPRCFCFYLASQGMSHQTQRYLPASTCDEGSYDAFSLTMSQRSAAAAAHTGAMLQRRGVIEGRIWVETCNGLWQNVGEPITNGIIFFQHLEITNPTR